MVRCCLLPLDRDSHHVILDPEDADWAARWRWSVKYDRHRRKVYAYRIGIVRRGKRKVRTSVWLHKEICRRVHGEPTRRRRIADHLNGESRDCRRVNLRWASAKENRRNVNGSALKRSHAARP